MRNLKWTLLLLFPLSVFSEPGRVDTIKGNQAFRDTLSVGSLRLQRHFASGQAQHIAYDSASGLLLVDTSSGGSLSLTNGLTLIGSTGQLGGNINHNTSAWYNLGTHALGLEISNKLLGTQIPGALWVDSSYSGNISVIGIGDFTSVLSAPNTAVMASYNGDTGNVPVALFCAQPDSFGAFRIVGMTNSGVSEQNCLAIQDTSSYVVSTWDGGRNSELFSLPGSSGLVHYDSSNVRDGVTARNYGLDFLIGDTLIRFNNFTHPVSRGMVLQTDDDDNGLIGYLHSTRDSFTVAGTLSIADGTQGTGKVLTSDAFGAASWQPPSVGAIIHTDSIHLTSAQLDSLYDTPVQLVAAPGSGHYIQILSIAEFYNYGTTAYSGGVIFVTEDNSRTGALFVPNWSLASTTNSFGNFLDARSQGLTFNNSGIARGTPVTIYSSAPLTSGDGSLDIIISYLIH